MAGKYTMGRRKKRTTKSATAKKKTDTKTKKDTTSTTPSTQKSKPKKTTRRKTTSKTEPQEKPEEISAETEVKKQPDFQSSVKVYATADELREKGLGYYDFKNMICRVHRVPLRKYITYKDGEDIRIAIHCPYCIPIPDDWVDITEEEKQKHKS